MCEGERISGESECLKESEWSVCVCISGESECLKERECVCVSQVDLSA